MTMVHRSDRGARRGRPRRCAALARPRPRKRPSPPLGGRIRGSFGQRENEEGHMVGVCVSEGTHSGVVC